MRETLTPLPGPLPPADRRAVSHSAGRGRVRLGAEDREVGPGDTICIPPSVVHVIENAGTEPLGFVYVGPPPYDPRDDFEVAG